MSQFPFIGLHIHKTAGTSFLRYLEKMAPDRLYGAYALRNLRRLEIPLWATNNLTSKDIFWGHAIYESFFYNISTNVRLFTFLREPNQRLISWFRMLERRKKLKDPEKRLEKFATSHSNSMTKMLVSRFPSLAGPKTDRLSDQALNVLEHMGFIGFQAAFSQHLPVLLEWMKVPIGEDLIGARHNIAKTDQQCSESEAEILDLMNDEDQRFYELAYQRYYNNPLNPERSVNLGLINNASSDTKHTIKLSQTRSAQRKYVSSLRFSIGEMGVEDHLRQMQTGYAQSLSLWERMLKRSSMKDQLDEGDYE